MAAIILADLTTGNVDGTGVFDKLMAATEAHLEREYSKSRIKGGEYATVYLGAMQSVMTQSLQFLLQEQKTDLEAQLLQEQLVSENLRQTNLQTENTVLLAQECKLRAEYDLIMEQKLKTISETALLNQKKVTEQAQVSGVGVDADSVIGKQKVLYTNQANGFKRDAEQKAAKLFADTWNVAQTTTGNIDPAPYGLSPAQVKTAVDTMLAGVNPPVV